MSNALIYLNQGLPLTNARDRSQGSGVSGQLLQTARNSFDEARETVSRWRKRSQGRAALAYMGSHQLKDIGITPDEAHQEARKPFWTA